MKKSLEVIAGDLLFYWCLEGLLRDYVGLGVTLQI